MRYNFQMYFYNNIATFRSANSLGLKAIDFKIATNASYGTTIA